LVMLAYASTANAQQAGGSRQFTIEQLIEIKHPSNPQWSPDGRHVLFVGPRGHQQPLRG